MRTLPGRSVWITNARSLRHRSRSGGLRARVAHERGRRLRPDPGGRRRRPAVHRRDDRAAPGGDRRGPGVHARRWEEAVRRERHRQARDAVQREAGAVSPRRQHRRVGRGARRPLRAVRRRPRARALLALRALQPVALGLAATAGLPARGVRRAHDRTRRRGHRHRDHDRTQRRSSSTTRRGTSTTPPTAGTTSATCAPDEVLVFKAHDTDIRRAGRVPHTAFTDPTCPPGTPTRASVEMRGLAFFD